MLCMCACARCSYGCLIFMATQIAAAMKHVESVDVVHGALSAASCLVVDQRFTVKLGDFGAGVELYAAALRHDAPGDTAPPPPVRWMACESVATVRMAAAPRSTEWEGI